jgi:hypothetical protein
MPSQQANKIAAEAMGVCLHSIVKIKLEGKKH